MNSQSPIITVIIPAYNAESSIYESVVSALRQTYSEIEIIVVDDCSSDRTVFLVEALACTDSRVRLIRLTENRGVAAARNVGVAHAKGEWVALLDSDDIWEPEKLQRQLNLARELDLDLVYCSYDFIDTDGRSLDHSFIVPQNTDYRQMLGINMLSCSTVMLRTELLRANPFPIDFYHEDYLLWMRLMRAGIRLGGISDVLTHYRKSHSSRSSNKFNAARHRWNAYRKGLGMGVLASAAAFIQYGLAGVKKHLL